MGGFGSGRHRFTHRFSTEELPALKVSMWRTHELRGSLSTSQVNWKKQNNLVASVLVEVGRGKLSVQWCRSNIVKSQCIRLSWTRCNYGGNRAWFLCPESQCQRRVTTLFFGSILACRHCLNLRYASTAESVHDRAIRRARKTRRQLSSSVNFFEHNLARPAGMRSKTYLKLLDSHTKQIETLTWILIDKNSQLCRAINKTALTKLCKNDSTGRVSASTNNNEPENYTTLSPRSDSEKI